MRTDPDHWDHMGSCWEVSDRGFPPQFIRGGHVLPLGTTICVKGGCPEMQVAFLQLALLLRAAVPHPFQHHGPISWKTIFPWVGVGEWFQNDSSSLPLCALCCCCCQVASVTSDSVQPHRQQPTRLPSPWDSPEHWSGLPFPSPMHESEK